MTHFLKSWHVFDGMLAGVYDVMYNKGIHVDELDLLFSVTNVYILKTMFYLQPKFEGMFLCQDDKVTCLCPKCLICHSFGSSLESLTTPSI